MALGDSYVTLPEMRAYLKIDPDWTESDPALEAAIAAASRFIDRHCQRQFNKQDTATTRVYKVSGRTVYVDDFWSTSGLEIGGIAWDPDTYTLLPENGVYEGITGWPYNKVRTCYRSGSSLSVTAKWGWDEVPAPIRQATLLQAGHLYKMADAPNGVAGMDQFGAIRIRSLPQVTDLLCDYVRTKVLVG